MSSKIFKISLPGFNVDTATPEQLALSSDFDYPKMKEDMVGVVDYTVPDPMSTGTYTIATINHNLGYKPMVQCFLEDLDGTFNTEFAVLPYFAEIGFMDSNIFRFYTTTTQAKIVLEVGFALFSVLPGTRYRFKYQIWVND